jgi:hypothetical protein
LEAFSIFRGTVNRVCLAGFGVSSSFSVLLLLCCAVAIVVGGKKFFTSLDLIFFHYVAQNRHVEWEM